MGGIKGYGGATLLFKIWIGSSQPPYDGGDGGPREKSRSGVGVSRKEGLANLLATKSSPEPKNLLSASVTPLTTNLKNRWFDDSSRGGFGGEARGMEGGVHINVKGNRSRDDVGSV